MQSSFSHLPCFHSKEDSVDYRFFLSHIEGNTSISYSFGNEYCPEVVNHVKYFLMAVGFAESTVMEAFARSLEEYEHALRKNNVSQSDIN